MRKLRNPSITIWPAMVAVTVEFSPQAEQRDAEQRRRDRRAEQRPEQLVGGVEFLDAGVAAGVEGRRGEDQDRRVDEEREASAPRSSRSSRSGSPRASPESSVP